MFKRFKFLLILLPILVLPLSGFPQTICDSNSKLLVNISGGEIRASNSRRIGSISSDGSVRNSNGKKLGVIQDGKIVNENVQTIYKYDGSGTVRDRNGRLIYRISDRDIRNSSGQLLLKYDSIDRMYITEYLCFFY